MLKLSALVRLLKPWSFSRGRGLTIARASLRCVGSSSGGRAADYRPSVGRRKCRRHSTPPRPNGTRRTVGHGGRVRSSVENVNGFEIPSHNAYKRLSHVRVSTMANAVAERLAALEDAAPRSIAPMLLTLDDAS